LGLLYGKGDFAKTLDVSTRAGQDSDCNPSSAAGVLGVMMGYDKIPDEWKSGIAGLADTKFDYTNYSFNSITESTVRRALKVIELAGGRVTESEVIIPLQAPKAPKLEQWNPGVPERVIRFDDPAWDWNGAWSDEVGGKEKKSLIGRAANGAGADVYLDGKKVGQFDAYIVERTHDNDLWHTYDLKPGTHTVRVVMRDDADARSKGKKIVIQRAITYRAA